MDNYGFQVALEALGRQIQEAVRNNICKHEWSDIKKYSTCSGRIGDVYYQECKFCNLINVIETEKKGD